MIRITAVCSLGAAAARAARGSAAWTVTSSAVVGSSAIRSSGLQASAIAIIDALAHPARELVRIRAQGALRDPGCAPARAARRRARPRGGRAEVEPEVLGRSAGRSRASGGATSSGPGRPSRSRAPRMPAARGPEPQQVLSAEARLARRPTRAGREQPEQREHRHRLAAAALAGDPEDLALARRGSRRRRRRSIEPVARRQPDTEPLDLEQSGSLRLVTRLTTPCAGRRSRGGCRRGS